MLRYLHFPKLSILGMLRVRKKDMARTVTDMRFSGHFMSKAHI